MNSLTRKSTFVVLMPKFKKIRRLVLGEWDLYEAHLVPSCIERQRGNGASRNDVGDKEESFARKEMEEINNWARLVLRLYFGWFGLQIAINALAMSWLFTYKGPVPSFGSLILLIFLGWNLIGTIGTLLVRKGLLECDLRIRELIAFLMPHEPGEGLSYIPNSPVPQRAINAVFTFCTATMLMSVIFWLVLLVIQGR